jgi:uncharacterized protein (TIGR01777 family)
MRIFLTGGTGLVGSNLARHALSQGHQVTVLTRSGGQQLPPGVACVSGDPTRPGVWQDLLAEHEAVVNLAGHPIFRRWTPQTKARIRDSRILTTRNVAEALNRAKRPGAVLVSASGVGYYGSRGDEEVDESAPAGDDFLALLARDWEETALAARAAGARVVLCRFGVVLARSGGALRTMLLPFKLGLGSPIGSGAQWFPWIHIHDLVRIILFALSEPRLEGPVNCTAPGIVRNRDFTKALARMLARPHVLPRVPATVLKLLAGEVSSILLTGQRAVPKKLLDGGFRFRYPGLETALRHLVSDEPEV